MEKLIRIENREQLRQVEGVAGLTPFDPEDLVRHSPDGHWVLLRKEGEAVGRCSLWWRRTASLPGHRLGVIGHYAARDPAAAGRLLRHACEELRARGSSLAVGPMDGNTWRRYRLVTERGKAPSFFLEPDNPDDWPGHFLDNGFTPLAHYTSAINDDLSHEDPRTEDVANHLVAQGLRIRPLDLQRLEKDLHGIYVVSTVSFWHNFLYTSIDEAEFSAQYRQILPCVRPELVLIAELRGRPIGFLFALPDLLQARRGQAIDTVILKTVAVLPERANAGLGSLLVARGHQAARRLGYTRAIHALMHESNGSCNISRQYAHTFRRYSLFAKRLGGDA